MITEDALDGIVKSLESQPIEMEEFYERMGEYYPVAVGWLTRETDLLTKEEQDYHLYLGMVVLTLMADNELDDADPESLQSIEEKLWDKLNADHPNALNAQAEEVEDSDAVGIFLIDALHTDDELPFLTPPGAIASFARLNVLAKSVELIH